MSKIRKMFEAVNDDESHSFERVANKRSRRPDLHAFLLLEAILPFKETSKKDGCGFDMVACAEHDQIWLEPGEDELSEHLTEDHVLELVRCGVWWDDSLSMYV